MAAGRFPTALDLLRRARAIDGYERAPRVMSAWWALGRRAVRTGLRAAWSSVLLTGDATGVVDLTGDGRIAVSGGGDGTIRLWDVQGGTCLRELRGHGGGVGSVCLSVDGRWVVSSSRDGTIRLWEVDTGTCRGVLTAIDQAGLSGLTRTGAIAGKPSYVPRQQVINFRNATPAVDVWALAACLYNALTGAHPRDFPPGKDPWQVILQAAPVPIRKREPAVGKAMASVIDKALREEPEIGYQSAGDLRRALLGI